MELFTPYLLIVRFCSWIENVSIWHAIWTFIKIVIVIYLCYGLVYIILSIFNDLINTLDEWRNKK